jgi:hypothetical protein
MTKVTDQQKNHYEQSQGYQTKYMKGEYIYLNHKKVHGRQIFRKITDDFILDLHASRTKKYNREKNSIDIQERVVCVEP